MSLIHDAHGGGRIVSRTKNLLIYQNSTTIECYRAINALDFDGEISKASPRN
jgi:hypothetical protein